MKITVMGVLIVIGGVVLLAVVAYALVRERAQQNGERR